MFENYLNTRKNCSCGKTHAADIAEVLIEQGVIERLPAILRDKGFKKVFMVSDVCTYTVAGKRIETVLQKDFSLKSLVLSAEKPVADEVSLAELLVAYEPDFDIILAVGSGTINDICKYFSYKVGSKYISVATAPSMDGYASSAAAMTIRNLKVTYTVPCPYMIIADTDILKNAPLPLIAAGVADVLGKYVSLCDWRLSHVLTGEYFCEEVAGIVAESLQKVAQNAAGASRREEAAISNVMEGLVISGIAMSFAGNSRPASGCEHHLSHYWEMQFLFQGKPPVLHGEKVGIGCLIALTLYKKLLEQKPDAARALNHAKNHSVEVWKTIIREKYGVAAAEVIAMEEKSRKNDPVAHKARFESIVKNWDAVCALIRTLPDSGVVEQMLVQLNGPVRPSQLGISAEQVYDAVMYAKELRERYSLLQLLWDLGMLEESALCIKKSFCAAEN